MIPRSHGSMYLAQSSSNDALYASAQLPPPSPLSDYGPATLSDTNSVLAKRRSTGASGTSEALQYYWSSSAGGRSDLVSSSFGSLASPLETSASHTVLSSPYSISPNPFFQDSRSQSSFQEFILSSEPPSPKHIRGPQLFAEPDVFSDATMTQATTTTPVSAASDAPSTLSSATSRRTLPMIPDAGMTPDSAQNTSQSMQPHEQRSHPHSPLPSPPVNMASDADTIRSSSTRRKRPPLPPIPTSTPQMSSPGSTYSSYSPSVPPRRLPSRPSTESVDSQYSADDNAAPVPPSLIRRDTAIRDELLKFNSHRKGILDMNGDIDVMDPTYEDWSPESGSWDKGTASAGSTIAEKLVTPIQEQADERVERPRVAVNTDLTDWSKTPSPHSAGSGEKTPQNSGRLLATPSPASSNSSKGRLSIRGSGSYGADPNRSTPPLSKSRHGNTARESLRLAATTQDSSNQPRSAPAHKTSFGEDVKVPGRPSSLLPSAKVEPPKRSRSLDQAEPKPTVVKQEQQQQSPSAQQPPRRSPDPPPRSELRQPSLQAVQETSSVYTFSPTTISPTEQPVTAYSPSYNSTSPYRATTLPTIINTPHTPVTSPRSSQQLRSKTEPSPAPTDTRLSAQGMAASSTIQDLTHVLDNAVDEIGLSTSGETPPLPTAQLTPPLLSEPDRSTPSRPGSELTGSSLPPRTSSSSSPGNGGSLSPISAQFQRPSMHAHSPSSSGAVGLGLIGSMGVSSALAGTQRSAINVGQSAISVGQNVGRHVRKASSILSLRSSSYALSPTNASFQIQQQTPTKSLPFAIMYGNIKALKTAGERAQGYQRGIESLGRADSGLREWCANVRNSPRQNVTKAQLGLGIRHPSGPPRGLTEPTPRNVSGASEFPMRQDSTTACEILVRDVEPVDKPTLPTNLPFPQLTTVKGSGSVQSLANISPATPIPSSKGRSGGGLLSALRLKKEKENTSLGPPTNLLASNGANGKPRNYAASSSSLSRASIDSPDGLRPPSHLPSPHGPRPGPVSRQSYDSSRSSLDSIAGARVSRSSNSKGLPAQPPHGLSPLSRDDGVSEEDVRYMLDMLPHAERSTIRSYLTRYGDTSYAMTAYLEDEKRGELLKV